MHFSSLFNTQWSKNVIFKSYQLQVPYSEQRTEIRPLRVFYNIKEMPQHYMSSSLFTDRPTEKQANALRDLGVVFDSDLNFSYVRSISRSAIYHLKNAMKVKPFLYLSEWPSF